MKPREGNYWFLGKLPDDTLHNGTRRKKDITALAAVRTNDQASVPVVSAIQPAIMGESVEPIPKYRVHRPTILPADSLEK